MKPIICVYRKAVVFSLVGAVILAVLPAGADAMFLPAPQTQAAAPADRAADLAAMQKALESRLIRQRLLDYGLSPEAAMEKISRLSDGQLHFFASRVDALQPGGYISTRDALIIILIILLIIVIV